MSKYFCSILCVYAWVFYHSRRNWTRAEMGTRLGYCCDRYVQVVLGELWKRLKFGAGKAIDSSMILMWCSVEAYTIWRLMEMKTMKDLTYEVQEGSKHSIRPFVWYCGFWLSGGEELAVIHKRLVPLTWNLYFSMTIDASKLGLRNWLWLRWNKYHWTEI